MKQIILILVLLVIPSLAYSQVISDYLIVEDIGSYKRITKGGPSGNILAGADHFGLDHQDKSYGIAYVNDESQMWIDVQVTQHAGTDSDRWLLHEIDIEFRNYYGMPGYYIKTINGNTVYVYGAGGRDYRWLSGNKVVMIEYHDSQLTKPEPLEVIQAYLTKHPSTLPAITMKELNSAANKTTWIKDEMDRRLWLCDKWFAQVELGNVELNKALKESVDHMYVFLNYREKYYSISATDEKKALLEYLRAKNETEIKNKLAEYKTWWEANKDNPISL